MKMLAHDNTDVVLDERTVVQPDLLIVRDMARITPACIQGAPVVIIDIVPKSTAFKDTTIKKDLYEGFGVSEYILLFPSLDLAERHVLEAGRYAVPERFNWDETLELRTLDLTYRLWEIYE